MAKSKNRFGYPLGGEIFGLASSNDGQLYFASSQTTDQQTVGALRREPEASDQRLIGDGSDDRIRGGEGADSLFGGGGEDRLFGGRGADRLIGGGANDVIRGDAGRDVLVGGAGRDTLFGGGGNDRLKGGGGNDRLTGAAGRDTLIGGGGNDTLFGGGGNDRLVGGPGNDRLIGGGGKDTLIGGGGKDTLLGGGGNDRLNGGGANDRLLGGAGGDNLRGDGGRDFLNGGGARDRLTGGAGDDTLQGGAGNDVMSGGRGDDTFVFTAGDLRRPSFDRILDFRSGQDRIDLRKVNGVEEFDDLDLTAVDNGVEVAIGANRILLAGARLDDIDAFDFILPGAANVRRDPFTGGPGPDAISSGPGNDLIRGLAGDDKLGAGAGRDTLVGGDGADIFVVRLVNGAIDPTVDIVRDFSYALGDKVGLTEVLSGVVFGNLEDVVRATPTGGDTIIAVKRGAAFQNVLLLEGVSFETKDLIYYGFTAPPRNSSAFIDNPYGFANNSLATADPAATPNGRYVAWVDQQNLDNDPFDIDPANNENNASRDVFIMNTETGAIERVSDRTTTFGTFEATSPAISDDGRFVAYVQGSRNSGGDVFVRDMAFPDRDPVLVSVANNGFSNPGTPISTTNRGGLAGSRSNESAAVLDMSADGRKVAFITRTDLSGAGESDTNGALDVYLRDLGAGTTKLISGINGVAQGSAFPYPSGDGQGDIVKISADGRYVVFATSAAFVGGDTDGSTDIYLYDTVRDRFLLVSSTKAGGTTSFDMSDDGRRIVFATNEAIDGDDTNGLSDIYVANINLATFTIASRGRMSEAENRFEVLGGDSYAPIISPDGDRIAFLTNARDFVAFDPRADFDSNNGKSAERLYVLDLDTRELTTPALRATTANRDSTNTHAALTDDGLVYRQDAPAAPGGNRSVSDVIAFADLVSPPNLDVPGGTSNSTAKVDRFSVVRSSVDGANDSDVFQFRAINERRDISISVEGVDNGAGTLADPKVTVYRNSPGTDGNIIGQDDNGGAGRNAFLIVEAGAQQTLFIEVESANGSTGSYRLRIDDDLVAPSGAAFDGSDGLF